MASLKIATWNVNSLKVRLPQVLDWLAGQQPDILGLQETKLTDAEFPADAIRAAGYQVVYAGQKTYNGVALLSRTPAAEVITDLPGLDDPQRRLLGATLDGLRVLNLYVPNGQAVGSDKYAYKLDWLDRLVAYVEAQLREHPRLVLLGDFNIAPEDRDVHDPAAWAGQVLCSEPERAAFRRLLELGLKDGFRLFEQEPNTFSWWDYRSAAFRRNLGLRIDHILLSPELAERCRACVIDKEPRKLERPSDHAPVLAELEL
ncbi:MAG TPA: exodeoxyribonuclease III [Candidatus Competibacteraceae bacterium]|nr:exodeoxyribonuclease III [Candidatus Competibacteraceae bacterium]